MTTRNDHFDRAINAIVGRPTPILTITAVAQALHAALPTHPVVEHGSYDCVETVALGPSFAVYAIVFPEDDTVGLSYRSGPQVVSHGGAWTLTDAVTETVRLISGVEMVSAFVTDERRMWTAAS